MKGTGLMNVDGDSIQTTDNVGFISVFYYRIIEDLLSFVLKL